MKCSVGVPLEAVPGIAQNDQTDLFLDQAALNEGMEGSAEHQNDRNERLRLFQKQKFPRMNIGQMQVI